MVSGKKAPALSAKMSFLGHIFTVFHPQKGVKSQNFEKNPFIVFLKEKQHILRYYMIIYATFKENQFLTPSTPQKRAKNAKKSNPLDVPLEMTHSYHLIPKTCL